MPKPESYLEHSVNVMQNLDMQALSQEQRGKWLGSGTGFTMYHLGHISLNGALLPVGLKQSHRSGAHDTINRLIREVACSELLTERVPQARKFLPAFMGLVAVENNPEAVAILTEDVSDDDAKKVFPRPVNDYMQEQMARGFADIGSADEVLQDEELHNSVAFDVDGQERWLDFTPSPIKLTGKAQDVYFKKYFAVMDIRDDLTRTIPPDSPLALSFI